MRVSRVWAQPASPAGAPANLATNRPAYSTQIKHVGGPGLLPGDFAYVTFGTNKFGFVMPAGFRLETQDRQKVTLVSADFSCLLTFRCSNPCRRATANWTPPLTANCSSAGIPAGRSWRNSPWPQSAGADRPSTCAGTPPAPCPGASASCSSPRMPGVLEFSLVSSLEKFEAGRQAFKLLFA